MLSQSFLCKHRNKEVKVTAEFPKQSDQKAEQEFIRRLKELYLEKWATGFRQRGDSLLSYFETNRMEGQENE